MKDTFGIAYRPALTARVFENRADIDLIEIIADDYFGASRSELRALSTLARYIPTRVHAVGLGLASCGRVDMARVCALARVIDAVGNGLWSEHLAFVRAGEIELGHLCAPPRTHATLEGLARNVELARRTVGSAPALENVATLIDPPCSMLDEATFTREAITLTGAPLLLDLHNLHANALNFGFDALACLESLPLERVCSVHIAGGRMLAAHGVTRLLDDHLHRVPPVVFMLLEELCARIVQPIEVVIERDGRPPTWSVYMTELELARAAVRRGRARSQQPQPLARLA